ncbi:type VII secretion integral membrane protein EccD [Streptomyces badius]
MALPEDIPVADLYPEILRLSDRAPPPAHRSAITWSRRDGTVLDSARTLAGHRILDGELLSMRPFSESLPPAVFDDVSDAVATAVAKDRTLWGDALMRGAGLFGGSVLLSLLGFVLWTADPRHDMNGLPGILAAVVAVLLLAFACVRARIYEDRASSIALGIGALVNAAVAGSGLLPLSTGQGIGRLQFLLACAAVLVFAVILMIVAPGGDGPFVAFVFASAVGLLVTFTAIMTGMQPSRRPPCVPPLAVGALAFLPGLSTRFAPIPSDSSRPAPPSATTGPPSPRPPARSTPSASPPRRGAATNCSSAWSAAAPWSPWRPPPVLGFSDSVWGQLLALATGVAMLMRAPPVPLHRPGRLCARRGPRLPRCSSASGSR